MADIKPRMCTLQRVYTDRAGTIPARIGDYIARVDWDDGEPDAIIWRHTDKPTLCKTETGELYIDFPLENLK